MLRSDDRDIPRLHRMRRRDPEGVRPRAVPPQPRRSAWCRASPARMALCCAAPPDPFISLMQHRQIHSYPLYDLSAGRAFLHETLRRQKILTRNSSLKILTRNSSLIFSRKYSLNMAVPCAQLVALTGRACSVWLGSMQCQQLAARSHCKVRCVVLSAQWIKDGGILCSMVSSQNRSTQFCKSAKLAGSRRFGLATRSIGCAARSAASCASSCAARLAVHLLARPVFA